MQSIFWQALRKHCTFSFLRTRQRAETDGTLQDHKTADFCSRPTVRWYLLASREQQYRHAAVRVFLCVPLGQSFAVQPCTVALSGAWSRQEFGQEGANTLTAMRVLR
jgi:hypothetical protein